MYTLMQQIPTWDKRKVAALAEKIEKSYEEGRLLTGDPFGTSLSLTPRELKFSKKYNQGILSDKDSAKQSPHTVADWSRFGSKIYDVQDILGPALQRVGFQSIIECTPTQEEVEEAYATSVDRHPEVFKKFESLCMKGRPSNCVVLGFGTYGDRSTGLMVGGNKARVVSATVRWRKKGIPGWVKPTRIQISLEWEIYGLGSHDRRYFTCIGVHEDGVAIVDHHGEDFTNGSRPEDEGFLAFTWLHRVAWEASVEVILGLMTKRIRSSFSSTPKDGKKKSLRGKGRAARRKNIRKCYLDVVLWERYVKRSSIKLVLGGGGSYEGHDYSVGVYRRSMWVFEKNALPSEVWEDIKLSKNGKDYLVKVSRVCNEGGYEVKGNKIHSAPQLTLVKSA